MARTAWRRLRKRSDWRSLSDGSRPELQFDAVILGPAGASGSTRAPAGPYDVYIRGRLVATRPRLGEAKAFVEKLHGPGEWKMRRTEPVMSHHYYYGPTEEFGPTAFWTRELD